PIVASSLASSSLTGFPHRFFGGDNLDRPPVSLNTHRLGDRIAIGQHGGVVEPLRQPPPSQKTRFPTLGPDSGLASERQHLRQHLGVPVVHYSASRHSPLNCLKSLMAARYLGNRSFIALLPFSRATAS